MCYFRCLACFGCNEKHSYILEKKCGVKECHKQYLKIEKALCGRCNAKDNAVLQTKFWMTPRVIYETVYVKKGFRNFESF